MTSTEIGTPDAATELARGIDFRVTDRVVVITGGAQAIADTVLERYGRIDALVNNAAIFTTLKMRPFWDIPLEEWDRVLRVNVTGCFLTARAVVPAMREAGWGRIVNISSDSI